MEHAAALDRDRGIQNCHRINIRHPHACSGLLHVGTKQFQRGRHANAVGRHVIFCAHRRDLPRLARREPRLQIPKTAIDLSIGPLALNHEPRRPTLDDHEVNFPAVRIPEVAEFQVSALGILFMVDPFQQVSGHEVLKPQRRLRDDAPVRVVVFLFLLDRADAGAPNGESR